MLGGLQGLLLTVLISAGVDFKKFQPQTAKCNFGVFFPSLIVHGTESRKAAVLIFGTLDARKIKVDEAQAMEQADTSGEYWYRVRGNPGQLRIVKIRKRN